MEWIYDDFKISDDKSLIVLDQVCEMLAKSYWASQRSKECTKVAISNSICYGIYHNNLQVGFARAITDYATTYYIADVIIDERYRGKGLGKRLIEFITSQEMYKNLRGMLATKDAHGLYEKYGFQKDIETFMFKKRESE